MSFRNERERDNDNDDADDDDDAGDMSGFDPRELEVNGPRVKPFRSELYDTAASSVQGSLKLVAHYGPYVIGLLALWALIAYRAEKLRREQLEFNADLDVKQRVRKRAVGIAARKLTAENRAAKKAAVAANRRSATAVLTAPPLPNDFAFDVAEERADVGDWGARGGGGGGGGSGRHSSTTRTRSTDY
jgi:hypothetical protein